MDFSLSRLPFKFDSSLLDDWETPELILDQNFAMGMFDRDLNPPMILNGSILRCRKSSTVDLSGKSIIKNEKNMFQVRLSVNHFKPSEIGVKVVDHFIVVHGKHEEMSDEHGLVQREFTRRYELLEGTEAETVKSSLSADGVLTVEAPKKEIVAAVSNERVVPISLSFATSEEKTTG